MLKANDQNEILAWPYTLRELRRDVHHITFPSSPSSEDLAKVNVFHVASVAKPASDPATENVVEDPPALVDGVWTQQWRVVAKTAEEQAAFVDRRIADIKTAIQRRLDDFVATRYYNDITSACTYATSQNATFAAEGQYCVQARDDTWSAAFQILQDYEAGSRALPTVDEVLAELPALAWPA